MDEFEIVAVPRRCDACGRDADASGMRHVGWAVPLRDAGAYCLGCASSLRFLPWSAECSRCGRETDDEAAAEEEGWRFFAGDSGELVPMCPDCASLSVRRPHEV